MCFYNRKIKIMVIFVLTTLVICCGWGAKKYLSKEAIHDSIVLKEYKTDSKIDLAVYYPLSESVNGASDFFVRLWESNVEEDKCYLFLPIGIKNKTVYWFLQESTNVWINQERILNGERFGLEEGVYEIKIEKDDKIICKNMEIMYSSSIPSLFIETETGKIDYIHEMKGNEEKGRYTILNQYGEVENGGLLEKIRGRGNVSWRETDKKSYQINLQEEASLLFMPQECQWILIPNAFDITLLRNKICYDLAEGLEIAYTPEFEYVDVYINGEYRGNYLLGEKIEIGANRVNINDLEKETELMNEGKLELAEKFEEQGEEGNVVLKGIRLRKQPQDISGGYLLELELNSRFELESSGFISKREQCVVIKSPQYASYEQVVYIKDLYQEFEDAVFSFDGINQMSGKDYKEYIDVESFVKMYLLEEVVKNIDTSRTSQFFYKPNDSESNKIYAGPVWDYDKALGGYWVSVNHTGIWTADGIYAGNKKHESDIWYALYQKEDFREKAVEMFFNEFCAIIEKEVGKVVPETVGIMAPSVKMNIVRWHSEEGVTIENKMMQYFEEAEERCNFLKDRVEFLKNEWEAN